MKKLLSILITAVMILGMLPTVAFATTTGTEAPLEYIINSSVFKAETGLKNGSPAAGGTNRFSNTIDSFDKLESTTQPWLLGNQYGYKAGTINSDRMQWTATQAAINGTSYAFLVFKIKIQPGRYKFDINAADHPNGAGIDVYLYPCNGNANGAAKDFTEANYVGHIDTYKAGSKGNVFEDKTVANVVTIDENDDYFLALKLTDSGQPATNSTEYINIAKFIFTKTPFSSTELNSTELSFSLDATEAVEIKVNGEAHTNDYVYGFDRGAPVTVTAGDAPEDYRFKAWVQGTADNGIWKSSNPEYTFNIMTHTYLTAVYEEIPTAEYVVEYYNENGKLHGSTEANGTTPVLPEDPSLTGYTFNMWTLDGKTKFDENVTLTEKLTRAVAKYNANDIPENDTVTLNEEVETAKFGTEVFGSDDAATHWLRDGRVVAYGKEYTHFVWDGTKIISSSAAVVKNPIVVIEDTLIDGANMIEYDAGDKSIVEVGILYGSESVEIGSCEFKATSQWNKSHGQFTASRNNSTEKYARGYLIYEDGDVYKIIYTDPVSAE